MSPFPFADGPNLVGTTVTDENGKLLSKSSMSYDWMSDLIAETDYLTGSTFTVTSNSYDGFNLVGTTVSDPSGNILSKESETYDGAGDLVSETDYLSTGASSTYAVTNNTYDGANLVAMTVSDQSGNVLRQSSMTYDETDQLLAETDYLTLGTSSTFTVTSNSYDGNNLVGTMVTEGGTTLSEEGFTYDESGNLLTTTDATGDVTSNSYDGSLLMATEVTNSSGVEVNVTSWTYNGEGQVLTTTDGDGNVTTNTWVGGDLTQVVVAGAGGTVVGTTSYSYNELGQQVSVTNANGQVIDSTYDGSELVHQTWYNASGAVEDYLTWDYDLQGNQVAASNDEGTYWMVYDGNRLVTQTSSMTGITLTYGYDEAGNVTSIADSSGATTSMTYNAANEVTATSYNDGTNTLLVKYTYDMAGNVLTETRYSNLAGTTEVGYTDYTYTGSEVASIEAYKMVSGVATQLSDYTYGYDKDGRLTTSDDNGTTTSDTYDGAGELTSSGSETYTYDYAGNRTGSGIVIGPDNQLTSDETWDYSYDAAGNMIGQTLIAGGETWVYTYNADNQMISAVESGTTAETVDYTYDVFGNRVSESVTVGGTTTTTDYVYTASGSVYATVVASVIQTRYVADVQGADYWEAQVTSAGAQWLLSDYQGSVVEITTLTGTGVQALAYDADGNITSNSLGTSFASLMGFQGMVYDNATGLNHADEREYDPVTDRWNRIDPYGFPSGQSNLYVGMGNDPTNATDPSGEDLVFINDIQARAVQKRLKEAGVNTIRVEYSGKSVVGLRAEPLNAANQLRNTYWDDVATAVGSTSESSNNLAYCVLSGGFGSSGHLTNLEEAAKEVYGLNKGDTYGGDYEARKILGVADQVNHGATNDDIPKQLSGKWKVSICAFRPVNPLHYGHAWLEYTNTETSETFTVDLHLVISNPEQGDGSTKLSLDLARTHPELGIKTSLATASKIIENPRIYTPKELGMAPSGTLMHKIPDYIARDSCVYYSLLAWNKLTGDNLPDNAKFSSPGDLIDLIRRSRYFTY